METGPHRFGEFLDENLKRGVRALRRLAYLGFGILAFGLILVGKIDTRLVDQVRAIVADVTAPALDFLSYPLAALHGALQDLHTLTELREENRRLRQENARLAQLRSETQSLRRENESMRKVLQFDPGPVAKSVTTRVIADVGGVFSRSVMVHVGKANGARAGLPVLDAHGLIGRVQNVGEHAARVLLITDLNSKVPVAIGDGRVRAIMSGRNDELPVLEFFNPGAGIAPGALVVSSGDGGVFFPGLPIGIAELSDQVWRVRPFADWNWLDYVRIVDYGPVPDIGLTLSGAR